MRSAVALTLLLALNFGGAILGRFPHGRPVWAAVRTMSSRALNVEDLDTRTVGYYEDLMNTSAGAVSNRLWVVRNVLKNDPERRRNDFLEREFKPHLNQVHRNGWLITNSHGMPDREYSEQKPAATRRIAMIGDSLVEGATAPFGQCFESLLEDRLNESHLGGGYERFEILNFGVGGYKVTQFLEVMTTKAAAFDPDAFVVVLSELTVARVWCSHVETLLRRGIDLKYDFLRSVVQAAGASPVDTTGVTYAKLARFRLPTIRRVLLEMKAYATQRGKPLIVFLVPTVNSPDLMRKRFDGADKAVTELGLPVIDVLDAFAEVEELEPLRAAHLDFHPNGPGHKMVFESLYAALLRDRAAWIALTGAAAEPRSKPGR